MSDYEEVDGSIVQDFAKRTLANLKFIEAAKNEQEADVFEVTQLVNSLLGLLVFPKEEFWNQIKDQSLDNIPGAKELKGHITSTYKKNDGEEDEGTSHLKPFIRHLRNGVSHFRVAFKDNEQHEITGLVIRDEYKYGSKNYEWQVTIERIEYLQHFIEWFAQGLESGKLLKKPKHTQHK